MHRDRRKINTHVFAKVHCNKGNVDFELHWRSMKNNENLCSHCPMRFTCKRENYRIKPFEMLQISLDTPKQIEVI